MKAQSICVGCIFIFALGSPLEAKVKRKASESKKDVQTQQLINAILNSSGARPITIINGKKYVVYANGMREPYDPYDLYELDVFRQDSTQKNWDKLSNQAKIAEAYLIISSLSVPSSENDRRRVEFTRRFLSQISSEDSLLKIYQKAWNLADTNIFSKNWRDDFYFEGAQKKMRDLFHKMKNLKPETASEMLCKLANQAGAKINPQTDVHHEEMGSREENWSGNSYLMAEQLMQLRDVGTSNSPDVKCKVKRDGENKEISLKDLMAEAKKIREPWLRQFEADRQNLKLGRGKPVSEREPDPFSKLNCSPDQLQKALKPFWDPLKENPNRAMISPLSVREPGCIFEGHFEQKANGSVTLHFRGYWASARPQKPLPVKSWESLVENWKEFADSLIQGSAAAASPAPQPKMQKVQLAQ